MKLRTIKIIFISIAFSLISFVLSAETQKDKYALGLSLYNNAVYEGAKDFFQNFQNDYFAQGYVILCDLKTKNPSYKSLVEKYRSNYAQSVISERISFEYARLLFDENDYGKALVEFQNLSTKILDNRELPEYLYKIAFCYYNTGDIPNTEEALLLLSALEYSNYTAPGNFLNATLLYNQSKFAQAEEYYRLAGVDPRFKSLTEYYIVDCQFNQQNYEFTISEGERIYASAPEQRRDRLARMISEAALVLGDIDKARLYYDDLSKDNLSRKDFFYSGTVLYSVKDYQGAIQYYNLMENRTDSLGQIANYHLANSYLNLRNQVAAMGAFMDAASVNFDPKMTEDAFFNYAKLAFDLNKDSSGFAKYMQKYSTSSRGEQIYGYMALAALYDRDYASAVKAYDSIEELDAEMQNNYTKANFLRGQQLFANGSYRDAIPYLRATSYYLPRTNRLNQSARYWLAESYYNCEEYSEAAKLYEDLFNASALYNMAEGDVLAYNTAYCYFKTEDYATASKWFDKYLLSSNKLFREDALRRRADCDFGQKKYKDAIKSYAKVIDEFGSVNNIYPYYQQALSYGLSGDKKKKLSTLLTVSEANNSSPLYLEALYELGRTQLELKNNKDAINSFTLLGKSSNEYNYTAKSLTGLGMVYRNMSQYDKALDSYKTIVSTMPGTEYAEEAMLAIESIYQTMRQPDKFLDYLEKNSLTKNKSAEEKEQMYFNTAEQLYIAGNYTDAITSVQKFLQNFPSSSNVEQARFYMAESYRIIGEKEKAIENYKMAMESTSSLSFVEMAKLRYSEISFELERYKDAYEGYKLLNESAKLSDNKTIATIGMMRSAFSAKDYDASNASCATILSDSKLSSDILREAKYIKAKSLLSLSQRAEAFTLFTELAKEPSTSFGAEANYMLIQNAFDKGEFDSVESLVYNFSSSAADQSYWLAKAYLVLGDSFTQREQYSQAQATYESIRDGYEAPKSGDDIEDNVRIRIERLNKLMEK